MYFLRGSLPWQGLKVDKREDRYKKIYEKKKVTTAEELCIGYPGEFIQYINYTRNLGFEQDPDYDYIRGLFKKIMEDNALHYDYDFDWTKKLQGTTNNEQKKSNDIPIKTNVLNTSTNNLGKSKGEEKIC